MLRKLGYLAFLVLCTDLFLTDVTSAKQIASSKPSQLKYQTKAVKTVTLSYKLANLDIKITESRLKGLLKAQISIENNATVIDKLSFDHMQDQGSIAGLFIPKVQPLSNYFLIVKHGDYDGRLLLIDKNGKINNIDGGSYFITDDRHYIFSDWEEDTTGTGFTVFDLLGNRVVYKTSQKDSAWFDNIDQWYKDGNGYFFTPSNYGNEDQQGSKTEWILVYKFNSNKILREPAKGRLEKATKIQLNSIDDKKSAVLVP